MYVYIRMKKIMNAYVYMYIYEYVYIYIYIYIFTYVHAYTIKCNLYRYMHMYFGHNYIHMYIFIGINWGMTSYFKSSDLFPFLSLHNRICQIPFDRDRDQFQLKTVKNIILSRLEKKGNQYSRLFWISQDSFCVTNRDRFFGCIQPWVQSWTGGASLGKNDKSFESSVKSLNWWCHVVEVETHGNLVDQGAIWPDQDKHLARVSGRSSEAFGPII